MNRARIAETVIAVVSSRKQAREIVGDLLEATLVCKRRFWWPVLQVVICMGWQRAIGSLLAATCFLWVFLPYSRSLPAQTGFPFLFLPAHKLALLAAFSSLFCWASTLLIAGWLGPRHRASQAGLFVSVVFTMTSCCSGLPFGLAIIIGGVSSAFLLIFSHAAMRRSAMVFTGTAIVMALGFLLWMAALERLITALRLIHGKEYSTFTAGLLGGWLISLIVARFTLLLLRRGLLDRAPDISTG